MSLIDALLSKGYFPSELPPSFHTNLFGKLVCANKATIPNQFINAKTAKLCSFSFARAGNHRFRRRLSLVNPLHFYRLSDEITKNWKSLRLAARSVQIGKSSPVFISTRPRAITPMFSQKDLLHPKAQNRASARLLLKTDISDFYHSIYTHSIPWALHTKATAKQNHSNTLIGNRLDTLIRNSQDGQTMGLPIGPDTSFLIAEIILAAIDSSAIANVAGLRGLRFIDDYEFAFTDHASADSCLAFLQRELLNFELRLNPRKTSLEDAPIAFEPPWLSELRVLGRFRKTVMGEKYDILRYFDKVAEFLKRFPHEHVSKYALASLRGFVAQGRNWRLYEPLLYQAIAAEPGAIRELMECLATNETAGAAIDKNALGSTLNLLVKESIPLGHDYEAAWGLWGMIRFTITLEPETIRAVEKSENSVIAILAMDGNDGGLIPGGLNTALWQLQMTTEALYEEQWLLAYEANIQGWLPSVGPHDHVDADPNFKFLKGLGVSFYDRAHGPIPVWTLYAP
jgi:hypothetical protein